MRKLSLAKAKYSKQSISILTQYTMVQIPPPKSRKYLFHVALTMTEKPHGCAVSLLFLGATGLAFAVAQHSMA